MALLAPPFRFTYDPDAFDREVKFNALYLTPMGALGGQDRSVQVHPRAVAGLAFHSNPAVTAEGADSHSWVRLSAGADATLLGTNGWRAEAGGEIRTLRPIDGQSDAISGGDARLRVERNGEQTHVAATGSWVSTVDPTFDLPDTTKRDETAVRGEFVHEESASAWSARLGWSNLVFREDIPGFPAVDRSRTQVDGEAGWWLLGGSDSRIGALVQADSAVRPPEAETSGYRTIACLLQWHHPLGDRSSLDLRLGGMCRTFDAPSFDDPANDDRRVVSPVGRAGLQWSWDAGSTIDLALSTGLTDAVFNRVNAARRVGVDTEFRIRLRDRLLLIGSGWLQRRYDTAPVPGSDRERADDAFLRCGPVYQLRDGVGVQTWVGCWRHLSATSESFTASILAIEMAVLL